MILRAHRNTTDATKDWDYDEITLTIKLKAGDKVWVDYFNNEGHSWENEWKNDAYFTGLLLYKI